MRWNIHHPNLQYHPGACFPCESTVLSWAGACLSCKVKLTTEIKSE